MVESEPPRALHILSLASKAIRAALGGSSLARKAAPASMAAHGRTLQSLISIVKRSQQKSPSHRNE
jgi:hypothetical protein